MATETETLAGWVRPIAEQLLEGRREMAALARSVPDDAWSSPSPLEGWTYKDLLAHLASGDWVCQTVLSAVTGGEPVDIGKLNLDFVNLENARMLKERQGRSVGELIDEMEEESEDTRALLARLTDEDESRKQDDAPMSLGQYLQGFPGHDRTHLEQLRTVFEGEAEA
jgi:uncharacterized protein (TIGR03083 family)